jgi:hypothetical protein
MRRRWHVTELATHPEGDGEDNGALEAAIDERIAWHIADEIEDVLVFLRRYERDQVLGIAVPPLGELIRALELGEHRRP